MVVATRRAPAAAATDVGTPRRGRRAAREPSPEPVEEEMASESESIADEEPEVDGAAVDDDDVDSEDDLEALADAVDASSSATDTASSVSVPAHHRLRSGLESVPLYLTLSGGVVQLSHVEEDAIAHDDRALSSRSVLTADFERRESVPLRGRPIGGAAKKDTAGAAWFDMPAGKRTPEAIRDLRALRMRAFIDPKRHYRKEERKLPKYFQFGTVVAGAADYYQGRLSRAMRAKSMVEQLVHDDKTQEYLRSRNKGIQKKKADIAAAQKLKKKANKKKK